MRRTLSLIALAFALALAGAASAQEEALTDAQKEIVKPIQTMIKAVQYGKDELASKSLDVAGMSRRLLGDTWATMTPEQQAEFRDGLGYLLEKLSFPRARDDYFSHLDAIVYDPPVPDAKDPEGLARVKSVIVVHRDYKKTEVALEYLMAHDAGGDGKWRILDVTVEGESTLDGIREDTVEPILEDGGVPLLLEKLRKKVAEVRAEQAKKAETGSAAGSD